MDADVMKHALNERPLTRDEADAFVRNNFAVANELLGMRCICLNATNQPIGFAGYRSCRYLDTDDVEFGWVLAKQHHGKGYATALGHQFIRHALDVVSMKRVLAACNPANVASEHILRDKLEMRFEREVEVRPHFRRRVYVSTAATKS
jgi:ribosomal-protein-alanine N-acetyltransferase